ncbi:MAG: YfhO family protein [Thermodesulfobacteriota bacterium]
MYFHPVLNGTYLLTERDLSVFFIPLRLLWVEAVFSGEFPLWNPYSFSGHPLLATLQPGVLYPPNLLFLLLPFDIAFNWIIVLHYFLAALFTFLLLRELKASPAGSLIGAVTFMLGGYLLSVHSLLNTLLSVVWTPLLILTFLRALRRGSGWYAVLSGVILAVMFTGGGIEVVYATTGLLLFLVFMPHAMDGGVSQEKGEGGGTRLPKRLGLLAAAIAIFLLLSAVQLLPFLELTRYSTRAGGLSYSDATIWSMKFQDLLQFFITDPHGYVMSDEKYWSNQSWLKTIYTGAIPFIMSLFFLRERKRGALPFVLIALLSLVLAMGENTPLYRHLFDWFPFFDKIRYPVKFLFLAILLLSVSAGLGYDSLRRGMEEGRAGWKRAALLLLALSTLAALAFGGLNFFNAEVKELLISRGYDYPEYNHVEINLFNTKRLLFFFIVTTVVIYASSRSRPFRKALPILLLAILTADLFFAHRGYYYSVTAEEYHREGEVMKSLPEDPSLFRVFVTPKTMEEEEGTAVRFLDTWKERLEGFNIEHHIFNIDGATAMKRGDHTFIKNLIEIQPAVDSTNLLAMLNVKYVVSIPPIESDEFRLLEVVGAAADGTAEMKAFEDKEAYKVYENLNYLPRFFLVRKVRIMEDGEGYTDVMKGKGFLPGEEVLLHKDPWVAAGIEPPGEGEGGEKGEGDAEERVVVKDYRMNGIELDVELKRPAILVASESWYPGWKVYVDGVEREVLRANLVLRAVALEKGAHEVVFRYEPLSFRLGLYITLATILSLTALGFFYLFRRRGGTHG